MTKCHHAIYVRKIFESLRRKPICNLINNCCRAIYCRKDADEITRSHFAIGSDIALESGAFRFWQEGCRLVFTCVSIVTIKLTKLSIVAMDHRASFNIGISKPNGNVVLEDGFALEYFLRRDFVTSRNLATTCEMLARHFSAYSNIYSCNHNVVIGM